VLVPVGHLAEAGEPEQDWPALVARARAAVRARPGRLHTRSVSYSKLVFGWRVCVGAQGA
jgi:hypothetical protein